MEVKMTEQEEKVLEHIKKKYQTEEGFRIVFGTIAIQIFIAENKGLLPILLPKFSKVINEMENYYENEIVEGNILH